MNELLKQYGLPGSVGVVIGIFLVGWIQPTTTAGVGLILITSIMISVIFSYVAVYILKK